MCGKKVAAYTQEIKVILMTDYCECICSRRGGRVFLTADACSSSCVLSFRGGG